MFLTVLSAIALTVGGVLTVQHVNEEETARSQETAPIVEVQPVQQDTADSDELAK